MFTTRLSSRPSCPCLAVLATTALTATASAGLDFSDVDVEQWVGTGENESMLIIDWQDSGESIAFGYRWSILDAPTGLDMFEAVYAAEDRLHRTWVDGLEFQALFGIGWDADDDGFDLGDPDDWYEEGWLTNGFWGYYNATDGTDWDFAPVGFADRELTDGAWDAMSWAQDFIGVPPTVPVVPAPSAAVLLLLGCARHYNRRR